MHASSFIVIVGIDFCVSLKGSTRPTVARRMRAGPLQTSPIQLEQLRTQARGLRETVRWLAEGECVCAIGGSCLGLCLEYSRGHFQIHYFCALLHFEILQSARRTRANRPMLSMHVRV